MPEVPENEEGVPENEEEVPEDEASIDELNLNGETVKKIFEGLISHLQSVRHTEIAVMKQNGRHHIFMVFNQERI
ncbi:hypothetical protein [Paraburkholderia hayleyella]|uniref:hypothetical protein n=1 Tax=Paraburkholderia hayleyella TaxID=2152889 RepID=UPI00129121D9|nr:hypothetical protein [Paraburkholderia hayleyella]